LPVLAQRSALGVAVDQGKGLLAAAVAAAGTSLQIIPATISGALVATGNVTIYDGANTETVAVTAYTPPAAGANGILTVSALARSHGSGVLVARTQPANAPTDFIPVKTFTPNDMITYLSDQNFRGSAVNIYGQLPGVIHGEYDTGGDVFPDSIGYLLAGLLGDVVTTGAAGAFTHVFAALNAGNAQSKSLTVTDVEPVQPRAFPGMVVADLSLAFTAAQFLTYTAKLTGYQSAPAAQPTLSFSTDQPLQAWTGGVTIGGVYSPALLSGTMDIKRNATVENTVSGQQGPYIVWDGPVEVSGKLTFIYEDESQLLNYLQGTAPSIDIPFTIGSGAALRVVRLHMSKANYTAGQKMRTGDSLAMDITYSAIANTTDAGASGGYSPVKVTLQNAKPAGTYQ